MLREGERNVLPSGKLFDEVFSIFGVDEADVTFVVLIRIKPLPLPEDIVLSQDMSEIRRGELTRR